MVVGDSKVVLDWFVGNLQLNALNPQPWMKTILYIKHSFSWLQCFHVHRQFNALTDSLSKSALGCPTSFLFYEEVNED